MSSFIGHSLIGAALGDNSRTLSQKERIVVVIFSVFLAIAPDFDYLVYWFFGLHVEPRYSHSLFACAVIFLIGCVMKRFVMPGILRGVSYGLIALAPLSHLICDYFVGVHQNPIVWPFTNDVFAFPYGILPSAGRIRFTNIYFWRNLGIELGILLPVAVAISRSGREYLLKYKCLAAFCLLSFVVFLTIGFHLKR